MSKILRRCLSLVLVFMLLASLSVSGALDASADNKTGDGLAAYAMTAYNEGWRYVWGGASYGAVDCSGLIYSYVGGGARVTEDMLYSSPESGYVSNGVPDIPGLGLWQPGHVGVYVGGGMAVDARDEISNVCYQSVSTKSWVMWFKVAGVSYGTDAGVTNSDRSDNDSDNSVKKSEKQTDTENKADDTLQIGSTGSAVNKLQERLKALGYFEEDTTEYFGVITKGALEDFQREAGLDVTGVYDSGTKAALTADSAPSKPEPVKTEEPEPVVRLDTEEKEEIDEESDESGAEMTAAEEDESVPEEDEADEEAAAEQTGDPDDDEQSSANGSEGSDADAEDADAVYSLGDEDSEISDIQYILIKLGYFDYDITGTYCENTADAVQQFRRDFLLGDKRSLNEETISAIYGVYDGTYEIEQTFAKESLYESVAADDETTADTEESTAEESVAEEEAAEAAPSEKNTDDETAANVTEGESETQQPEEAQTTDSEEDTGASNEQSVTITVGGTDTEGGVSEASSDAQTDEDKPAAQTAAASSTGSSSEAKSPKTGEVVFVQTGVEDYFTMTYALILIGVSLIVIFFAGTVHYWNVSMEKRKQRARRATTVSVYRRSSM